MAILALLLANAITWVLITTLADPKLIGTHPLQVFLWWGEFTALATALTVAMLLAAARSVPVVLVICTLAMWALLPATLLAAYWLVQLFWFAVLVLAAPLLLTVIAWALMARGHLARGTAILEVALLGLAGLTATWIPVLSPPIWLTSVLWHLTLAGATLVALAVDLTTRRLSPK